MEREKIAMIEHLDSPCLSIVGLPDTPVHLSPAAVREARNFQNGKRTKKPWSWKMSLKTKDAWKTSLKLAKKSFLQPAVVKQTGKSAVSWRTCERTSQQTQLS